MRVECDNCGSNGHPTYACTRPAKKSTAARKDVPRVVGSDGFREASDPSNSTERKALIAGTQSLPVDTNSQALEQGVHAFSPQGVITSSAGTEGDADRPKFDKVAYQAKYMREVYRPRLKAKKEAAK